MQKFNNKLFEGTLLDGIPFNYRYVTKRPKHIYEYKNNKITLHNFPAWRQFPTKPTEQNIRKLFLHDTCHAILFHVKNQNSRIFMNDCGMSWKYVSPIAKGHQKFHIHSHLMDEFKVSVLFYILSRKFQNKRLYSRQRVRSMLVYCEAWHTMKIFDGEDFDEKAVSLKEKYIDQAISYWYDMGMYKIEKHVRSFVEFLNTKNLIVEK